jgi:hypothetical protein
MKKFAIDWRLALALQSRSQTSHLLSLMGWLFHVPGSLWRTVDVPVRSPLSSLRYRHYGGGEWCGGCWCRTAFRLERLGARRRAMGTTSGSVRGGTDHHKPSARVISSLKIAILEPFL